MSDNFLQNGALDRGFAPYRNDEEVQTAAGWGAWWLEPAEDDPEWKNHKPLFEAAALEDRPVQKISSPWATHTAGLYQQLPAAPGNRYQFQVEGQAWLGEKDQPVGSDAAADPNLQIGLDPTGGLDPASPLIIWSDVAQPLGQWQTLELTAAAEAEIITVYLKSAPALPRRQQAVFWRNALLAPIGRYQRSRYIVGPGDTYIAVTPEEPQPGQRVMAVVSSARNQSYVDLTVTRPDGAAAVVAFQGVSQEEGRWQWRYEFGLAGVGQYDARFVGDRGARLLAQQWLDVAETTPAEASDAQAAAETARIEYRRVYVLLPPTADAKWAAGAVRGSFDGRYTVGFSADDAGVGALKERHVLAVNPHHWPEPLTAGWFRKHYPGVRYTAVVANTPDDLEAWLRNWVGATP